MRSLSFRIDRRAYGAAALVFVVFVNAYARADTPARQSELAETGATVAATRNKPGVVVAPIPQANPAIGNGLAVVGAVLYQPKHAARPWTTGIGALYTDTESWAAGLFQKAYLGDNYRVTAFGGYGDFKLDFYGVGAGAGARNRPVKLDQKGAVGLLEALRRVRPDIYVGLKIQYLKLNSSLVTDFALGDYQLSAFELESALLGVGVAAEYDTRDSEYAPNRGVYVTASALGGAKSWGSDFGHTKTQASINGYFGFGESTVLAGRAVLCYSGEGAPFYDLCMYGQSNDLRGYATGRYRDHALLATQVELRQHLFGRFGAVAFAGVGGIGRDFEAFPDDHLLPAAGIGLRFVASKAYKVNVSVDYAVGEDDDAFYVYIGESF